MKVVEKSCPQKDIWRLNMKKIDLITGFLGAGKTTFLLKYARYWMEQGFRIGILEYDYGAINTDMLLLNQLRGPYCELEMVAAACDRDCLRRRFKTKLIAMAMSGYDRVIVEPSGVFDMDMFFDELREEPLEDRYEIGNVIAVVNANLGEDLNDIDDFILASQASAAGCVLFSHVQMATERELENSRKHIEEAAKKIQCRDFNPSYLAKDWDTLSAEDYAYLAGCGYHISSYVKLQAEQLSAYSSVSFIDVTATLEELKYRIRELFANPEYGEVTRVKGFVIDGGISHQINATRYEIQTEPIGLGQKTLIVIGSNLNTEKIEKLIRTGLE